MVYAFRLKNVNDEGRVIDGFGIRRTWQYSTDKKAEVLEKWPMVVLLKAENIQALKGSIDKYGKEAKNTKEEPEQATASASSQSEPATATGNLKERLNAMNLAELKQFAKDRKLPEAEYSTYTRSKLIDYLLLAVSEGN